MIQVDKDSQAKAKEYVLNKPILRPDTKWWHPVLLVLFSLLLGVVLGVVIIKILRLYLVINNYINVIIISIFIIVAQSITIKNVLILSIKSYQRYASENIRRSCLCKPTCSEYAILVLNKYSLIKAIRLIYIRLTKTCTGKLYKIDFPE